MYRAYRHRNRYVPSSHSKHDVKVEAWGFFFFFLCAFQLDVCAAHQCRLGSDAGCSASPYPASKNGNASNHNAHPLPLGLKKKGRPPKNKPKGMANDTPCCVV